MLNKNFKKNMTRVAAGLLSAGMLLGSSLTANANGLYISELTGLPISTTIQNQRPIAVMVDNEKTALQHYGTAEADIVYEMVNSTKNNRITRLMCIYKDYNAVPRIGSIRSIRPTNVILAGEYNAVCVHDGGPFYINDWLKKSWSTNLSGGFKRINNGKRREFTEYVTTGEVTKRMNKAKYSINYTNDYLTQVKERETHFLFNETETLLSTAYNNVGVSAVGVVDLSQVFPHNSSKLVWNAQTLTYDYYEYGAAHIDGEDKQVMSFKNVILQEADLSQLDQNGYMIYNVIGTKVSTGATGYYITDGQVIPITWTKASETAYTHFYDYLGNEIKLNPGKTYIGIIPSDTWDKVVFK